MSQQSAVEAQVSTAAHQASAVRDFLDRGAVERPWLADLANYLVLPSEEEPFYSSEANSPFVDGCYVGPTKLLLYRFDSRFARYGPETKHAPQRFAAMYKCLLRSQGPTSVVAGYCTSVELKNDYVFISTSCCRLTRTKQGFKVLQAVNGQACSFLYNGRKLYLRVTPGCKLWALPPRTVGRCLRTNGHFPGLRHLVLSCINHALGPAPHVLRDVLTHEAGAEQKAFDLLRIPWGFSILHKQRTKVDLLRRTGGLVSKFSGKLPFREALIFVEATARIQPRQYDYLLTAYRAEEALRRAESAHVMLVQFYLVRYRLREVNDNYYHHKQQLIADYLHVCEQLGHPVDLGLPSLNRLNEEHANLAQQLQVRQLQVHPDFKQLQVPWLELLSTPERLMEEGQRLHHCVASYAEVITQGRCGIYSTHYEGEGYTLELQRALAWHKQQPRRVVVFLVAQLRGFANKAAPANLLAAVKQEIAQFNATSMGSELAEELAEGDEPF